MLISACCLFPFCLPPKPPQLNRKAICPGLSGITESNELGPKGKEKKIVSSALSA
jgi:hypothetical protein